MILSMFILLSIGNAQEIEGRWIPGGFSNTMYEFIDTEPFAEAGLRYTYYCDDYSNVCDSAYWNSLDTSDAIPNPKPYWVDGNTLIIDLFYYELIIYSQLICQQFSELHKNEILQFRQIYYVLYVDGSCQLLQFSNI